MLPGIGAFCLGFGSPVNVRFCEWWITGSTVKHVTPRRFLSRQCFTGAVDELAEIQLCNRLKQQQLMRKFVSLSSSRLGAAVEGRFWAAGLDPVRIDSRHRTGLADPAKNSQPMIAVDVFQFWHKS